MENSAETLVSEAMVKTEEEEALASASASASANGASEDAAAAIATDEPLIKEEDLKCEEEIKKEEEDDDDEDGMTEKHDPELYGYVANAGFTSEVFKLEINNLPRRVGFGQLKKRLLTQGVKPVKLKLISNGDFAFVTFRNETERLEALEKLNGHTWKGRDWKVKKALPKVDPMARKRKNEGEGTEDEPTNKTAREGEPPVGEPDLPLEERLQNAVTPLWNLPYTEQLRRKEANIHGFLCKFSGIINKNNPEMAASIKALKAENSGMCCLCDVIKASPIVDGYRNKCEFTIGQSPDGVDKTVGFRLGAYKGGCVSVVSPAVCLHISECMKTLVVNAQNYLQNVSTLQGFNPTTRQGHWQVLTMRTTRRGDVMLIFSLNAQDLTPEGLTEEKEKLTAYFTSGPGAAQNNAVTSLFIQQLGDRSPERTENSGNIHKSSGLDLLMGEEHMTEDLLGMKFRISNNAFFQVNTEAAEVLYTAIGDECKLSPDSLLLDVCCGTGTIGLTLAKHCKKVIGIEMVKEAVEDAEFNAKLNAIDNVEFHCGKAEDVLPVFVRTLHLGFSEVVAVVDPPRNGLHPHVVKALRKATFIKKLIYVSCNVAGATQNLTDLTRAVSRRIKGPEFKITRAIPVDLFPHSNHIELILLLERDKEF